MGKPKARSNDASKRSSSKLNRKRSDIRYEEDDEEIKEHSTVAVGSGFRFSILCVGLVVIIAFGQFILQMNSLGTADTGFMRDLNERLQTNKEMVDALGNENVEENSDAPQQYQGDKPVVEEDVPEVENPGEPQIDDSLDQEVTSNVNQAMREWEQEEPENNQLKRIFDAQNPKLELLDKRQSKVEQFVRKIDKMAEVRFVDIEYTPVDRESLKNEGIASIGPEFDELRARGTVSMFSPKTANGNDYSPVPGAEVISSTLKDFGYHAFDMDTANAEPLWHVAFGLPCPPTKQLASLSTYSIFLCSTIPNRARQVAPYLALKRARGKFGNVDIDQFVEPVFNALDESDKEYLRQYATTFKGTYSVFFREGFSKPQFTENVVDLLGSPLMDPSKKLIMKANVVQPLLVNGFAQTFRTFALIASSKPYLVLYNPGYIVVSKDKYQPFQHGTHTAKTFPWGVQFPGNFLLSHSVKPQYTSWQQFEKQNIIEDIGTVQNKLKAYTAFVMAALSGALTSKTTESKAIVVQHVCVDFILDKSFNPWFHSISVGCPVPRSKTELQQAMTSGALQVAENVLLLRESNKPISFDQLNPKTKEHFDVIVDETASGIKPLVSTAADGVQPSTPQTKGVVSTGGIVAGCQNPVGVTFLPENKDASQDLRALESHIENCGEELKLRDLFASVNGVDKEGEITEQTYTDGMGQAMSSSLDALNAGDWASAAATATKAKYKLCWLKVRNAVTLVWQPQVRGNSFLAIKVANCEGAPKIRPLILEVPHPYFDRTRAEGIQLFVRGSAKVLLLSGSHRCAQAPESGCTGSIGIPIKTNCPHPTYTNADVAHSTHTMFYNTHVHVVDELFPQDLVVSLHSTKKEAFVISDGTSGGVSPNANVARLGTIIGKAFEDRRVDICNLFQGSLTKQVPDDEQTICGATNMQGRHMNGSPDPCHDKIDVTGKPIKATGRFIHIEQPVVLVKVPEVSTTVGNMIIAFKSFFENH